MRHTIVTGASHGLGEAVARRLINAGHHVICLARTENKDLEALAGAQGTPLDYECIDLTELDRLEGLMRSLFARLRAQPAGPLALINNAATVSPIGPLTSCRAEALTAGIKLNLIAPMLMTGLFLRFSSEMRVDRTVVNISSSAAKKPHYGWACYCSGKAGLEMLTQCADLEQAGSGNPARIVAFDPGIMDTGMQGVIRAAKPEDFPELERFVGFKDGGRLAQPDAVAAGILALLP